MALMNWLPVWRRNFLVWRKLAFTSILGTLADPLIYMLGLGYGLGNLLPSLDGQPYLAFLAAGTLCVSSMNAASFEAMYNGFSRMHVQKTWDAILNTPLGLTDVLAGELFWAATKAFYSGAAILVVVTGLGLTHGPMALWVLPAVVVIGLAFAALGLVWTALAPGYDFFMYFITLFITPMTLISGVFFPTHQLPAWLSGVGAWLPLAQGVALVRPLLAGAAPPDALLHVAVLLGTAAAAFALALRLTRRRLLK